MTEKEAYARKESTFEIVEDCERRKIFKKEIYANISKIMFKKCQCEDGELFVVDRSYMRSMRFPFEEAFVG